MEAAGSEIELLNDERMQEASEICAGREANSRPRFVNRAGSAYALTSFEDQHALAGTGEIGSAGKAIMPGTDNDRVPAL
jgi:hypothetical protein